MIKVCLIGLGWWPSFRLVRNICLPSLALILHPVKYIIQNNPNMKDHNPPAQVQ